ncbi:MAG TPA: STAS/SEC14 domain-containing protein [Polyangiaceae bacterium]|jgi:hypothetical protein|nr:STAS/SEC14 domain-containing protein [Polyangiaceae bacterium]
MIRQTIEAGPHARVFGGGPGRPAPRSLAHRFLADCGVLLVQPVGPLRAADFDIIAQAIDPWRESRGRLRGLVIQTREFSGWENVAGFIHHVQFVRDHHHAVRRVALATDIAVPQVEPGLVNCLIRAELRLFERHELRRAVGWAAGGRVT